MSYEKYYKKSVFANISKDSLLPCIQKKLSKDSYGVWVEFDLKNNKIILSNLCEKTFGRILFGSPYVSIWQRIFNKILRFIQYKCKISFRANIKAMQTELIKHIGIRALTQEKSFEYVESKHKYEILYGIINSAGLRQPVRIWDNVCYIGNITHFLYYIDMKEKSTKLWEIWTKGKMRNIERRKFKRECEKTLMSMITVKK